MSAFFCGLEGLMLKLQDIVPDARRIFAVLPQCRKRSAPLRAIMRYRNERVSQFVAAPEARWRHRERLVTMRALRFHIKFPNHE
jgi:hypothetical protein